MLYIFIIWCLLTGIVLRLYSIQCQLKLQRYFCQLFDCDYFYILVCLAQLILLCWSLICIFVSPVVDVSNSRCSYVLMVTSYSYFTLKISPHGICVRLVNFLENSVTSFFHVVVAGALRVGVNLDPLESMMIWSGVRFLRVWAGIFITSGLSCLSDVIPCFHTGL